MRQTKIEIMAGVNPNSVVTSKLIAGNTVEYHKPDKTRVIRFHNTDIITFKPNGDVVLNSGGWMTVTTKQRMNMFIQRGWRIIQSKSVWYLETVQGLRKYVFQDGITIKADGSVVGAGEDRKKLDKRMKAIKKFVDGYMNKLTSRKMPQPSDGDCWFCLLVNKDGRTLGDLGHDKSDHILAHFKEKYYVPSMVFNAIKEIPVSRVTESCLGYWFKYHDNTHESMEKFGKEQVRKSLTRYLKRRLGMAA